MNQNDAAVSTTGPSLVEYFKSRNWERNRLDCRVYYVTDIHLDDALKTVDECDRKKYIGSLTRQMCTDANVKLNSLICRTLILVGGDVSHDSDVVRMFYDTLNDAAPRTPIVAVLGNHEVADERTCRGDGTSNIDSSTRFYRSMLAYYGACLLERSLLVFSRGQNFYIMNEQELEDASLEEIRKFTDDSLVTVFGGMGFASRDPVFNAGNGLYGNTLRSVDEERCLSDRTSRLYGKLRRAIPDRKVIVLTHMPLESWSDEGYQAGWSYVSGHTHSNKLDLGNDYKLYYDGQVGYGGTPSLKHFFLDWESRDIFADRPDGEYAITADEYRTFYFRKGMRMTSKMTDDVIMLKRDGVYCFFVKNKKGQLCMLDGGMKKRVPHDLDYYYDNLALFSKIVRRAMLRYNERMNEISSEIRSIGGSGRIHGCIVDIDFFDHVYVNPLDGMITPYYALDIIDKTVYPSVEALLRSRDRGMHERFVSKVGNGEVQALTNPEGDNSPAIKYYETDIYAVSRLIYKFQRMEEYLVVRTWNDAVLGNPDSEESLQSVTRSLLGPVLEDMSSDR